MEIEIQGANDQAEQLVDVSALHITLLLHASAGGQYETFYPWFAIRAIRASLVPNHQRNNSAG